MIKLPIGLFILKKSSNIDHKNIEDLINISIQLRRKIDIFTDIKINDSLFDNHWCNKIEKYNDLYDYVFIADDFNNASNHFNNIKNNLKDKNWVGYMIPIKDKITNYNDTYIDKNSIKNIGYDSAIFPMIKNVIGNNSFIYFNKLQDNQDNILTQVDSGNHNIIWGNIFRSCGFFSGRVYWEEHELCS